MASSTQDPSKKDLPPDPSATSTRSHGHPTPAMGYPQPKGYPPHGHPPYPPPMGYPPHGHPPYPPPQYQPYPQTAYSNYPYTQPPPAAYYAAQPYQTHNSSGFLKGIIAAMILIVVVMFVSSIITWIVLRPEIPVFTVESFSVSNLNISKPNYSATWDSNVTVENPNQKLKIYMNKIQTFVDYNEGTLSSSFADPLFMDTNMKNTMTLKTSMNDSVVSVDLSLADEMGRQRGTGTVIFSLRMLIWSTFKSGSWWTRHVTMKVFCEDLNVVFEGSANNGALPAGKPRSCLVYA